MLKNYIKKKIWHKRFVAVTNLNKIKVQTDKRNSRPWQKSLVIKIFARHDEWEKNTFMWTFPVCEQRLLVKARRLISSSVFKTKCTTLPGAKYETSKSNNEAKCGDRETLYRLVMMVKDSQADWLKTKRKRQGHISTPSGFIKCHMTRWRFTFATNIKKMGCNSNEKQWKAWNAIKICTPRRDSTIWDTLRYMHTRIYIDLLSVMVRCSTKP